MPSPPPHPQTLNESSWDYELQDDPDRNYLLHGIRHGFNIINDSKLPGQTEVLNYSSAIAAHDAVEGQILEEIQEGRYIVVEHKPTIISALGAIPKPDGGVRIIHDASRPTGHAINDFAMLESKIKYQSVDDAVKLIKPTSWIAKVDLKSAYRSVSINPEHQPFTGLKWKFKGHQDYTYLVDARLPFGCRLSVEVFHRLSHAVQRFMAKRHIRTVVYLDDWLVIGDSFSECQTGMNVLINLLRNLGFAISYSKVEGPSQCLTFLGIEIDIVHNALRLPAAKVTDLLKILRDFRSRSRASQKQLQHLAGKLVWASKVVHGGRTFLQSVLDVLRPLRLPSHKAKMTISVQNDLDWWIQCINAFNGQPMTQLCRPHVDITTDACNLAGGMTCGQDWAYVNWEMDYPDVQHLHINFKECLTAILAIYRWAPNLQHTSVTIHTDNMTTRAIINRGACKDYQHLMPHLRLLFWICNYYDIELSCEYLPGSLNIASDTISRLHQPGHLLYWHSLINAGHPFNVIDFMQCAQLNMSHDSLMYLVARVPPKIPWLANPSSFKLTLI